MAGSLRPPIVGALMVGVVVSCTGSTSALQDGAASMDAGVKSPENSEIVVPLSLRAAFRRASVLLAGRLPRADELVALKDNASLEEAVRKLCEDEEFYLWLHDTWNDVLRTQLVDAGTDIQGIGNEYGRAPAYYDPGATGTSTEKRDWAMLSFGEEPLRLIAQVVREGRPFGEILTSARLLVNPYTAAVYGLPHSAPIAPENYEKWEWASVKPMQRMGTREVPVPHSGILASPSFLLQWPTSLTNRSRKRADFVLRNFLATDILGLINRPTDVAAFVDVENAPRTAPACAACHNILDPVAGGFQGLDEKVMTRAVANDAWHPEMAAAGLGSAVMPVSARSNAVAWLGQAIATDKRFALAMTRVIYTGLLGEEPLGPPATGSNRGASDDANSKTAREYTLAYDAQQAWISAAAEAFLARNQDLRELVVRVVTSPYFLASSMVVGTASASNDALGVGRLLTPEMLVRKLRSTIGSTDFYWIRPILEPTASQVGAGWVASRSDPRSQAMLGDFQWRNLLGGGASAQAPDRSRDVSTTMFAAWEYIALRVSCNVTAFDFTVSKAERRLFPLVEVSTRPYSARTNTAMPRVAMPANIEAIKANIRELHWRLLGEELSPDSDEERRTFALFDETWKEQEMASLSGGLGAANGPKLFHYKCAAGRDLNAAPVSDGLGGRVFPSLPSRAVTGVYGEGQSISDDPDFTLRAWQTVITYLMTDYRFLYE